MEIVKMNTNIKAFEIEKIIEHVKILEKKQ